MNDDHLPDVRDGLTRAERIVLFVLQEAQREREGRAVPTALLYGRVVEYVNLSVPEFQRILSRLVGLQGAFPSCPPSLLDAPPKKPFSSPADRTTPMPPSSPPPLLPPPPETVERWAWDYVRSTDLGYKLAPPPPPRTWEEAPIPRRLAEPGRPTSLVVVNRREGKTPGPMALRSPERRAELVHTFLHHELQAAELMCWALLAFPETPRAFRAGLLGIARDEIRHMALYAAHLASLGLSFGARPVRDWFWQRVPEAETPAHFVATMGIGFEGANLDHTLRFADRFRAAGDEEGARLEEQIHAEEIPHVRFALHWFRVWTGHDDFATWARHLAPPLSPLLMRGAPLEERGRRLAGLSDVFIDELSRWQPREFGS